jgi:hypothetical protein
MFLGFPRMATVFAVDKRYSDGWSHAIQLWREIK